MFEIAVLTSGLSRGSNLQAIDEYIRNNNLPVNINFVIRTRKFAPIADVCEDLNIPCYLVPFHNQNDFEEIVLNQIYKSGIQLLALAGFLKKLSSAFIRDAGIPILNIHPALLPKYGGEGMYGKEVHTAVYNSSEKLSGATVHLVDSSYDHGKIIAQEKIDISECKSAEEISARVLEVEHQIYGKAIWEYLSNQYSC